MCTYALYKHLKICIIQNLKKETPPNLDSASCTLYSQYTIILDFLYSSLLKVKQFLNLLKISCHYPEKNFRLNFGMLEVAIRKKSS